MSEIRFKNGSTITLHEADGETWIGCNEFDEGTWYQSAVSGGWYRNKEAAGDVCAIRTDGVTKYQPEPVIGEEL